MSTTKRKRLNTTKGVSLHSFCQWRTCLRGDKRNRSAVKMEPAFVDLGAFA